MKQKLSQAQFAVHAGAVRWNHCHFPFKASAERVKGIEPKPLQAYKTRVFRERLERVKGIEPSYAAWEAAVLPLNYTRKI